LQRTKGGEFSDLHSNAIPTYVRLKIAEKFSVSNGQSNCKVCRKLNYRQMLFQIWKCFRNKYNIKN